MNALQFLTDHGATVLFWVIFVEQIGPPIPAIPLLDRGRCARRRRQDECRHGPARTDLRPRFRRTSRGTTSAVSRVERCWDFSVVYPWSRIPASETPRTCFIRNGPRALLLAKFIPGFSTVAPPLAGIVGMTAATFILYDVGGTLIWAGVSAGVGALFSNQLEQLGRLV